MSSQSGDSVRAQPADSDSDELELLTPRTKTSTATNGGAQWENSGIEIVKLIVGRKRKEFSIHKNFICQASEAMKAAFCGEFEEGRTGVMTLIEDDTLVVQDFIAYCYPNFNGESLKARNADELISLYIFADKYRCQNGRQEYLHLACLEYQREVYLKSRGRRKCFGIPDDAASDPRERGSAINRPFGTCYFHIHDGNKPCHGKSLTSSQCPKHGSDTAGSEVP